MYSLFEECVELGAVLCSILHVTSAKFNFPKYL